MMEKKLRYAALPLMVIMALAVAFAKDAWAADKHRFLDKENVPRPGWMEDRRAGQWQWQREHRRFLQERQAAHRGEVQDWRRAHRRWQKWHHFRGRDAYGRGDPWRQRHYRGHQFPRRWSYWQFGQR